MFYVLLTKIKLKIYHDPLLQTLAIMITEYIFILILKQLQIIYYQYFTIQKHNKFSTKNFSDANVGDNY